MHYIKTDTKEVEVTESGRLADLSKWDEEIAKGLAKTRGIVELTDEHFAVINCLRSLNGESSDMYKVMQSLEKVISDWRVFKDFFPGGLDQAFIISGCKMP